MEGAGDGLCVGLLFGAGEGAADGLYDGVLVGGIDGVDVGAVLGGCLLPMVQYRVQNLTSS